MENKINLAELLKDCPKGMELYSPMFGEVYLYKIRPSLGIVVTTSKERDDFTEEFLYDGRYGINGECMLFPSKGKTTWEGFVPPCKFKDGDIISNSLATCIFKGEGVIKGTVDYYCGVVHDSYFNFKPKNKGHYGDIADYSLATEEEKEKLFDAIKANGYKWNAETKTLEKLEVKKFDISTLVPFESRVLVRDFNNDNWRPAVFGGFVPKTVYNDLPFVVVGGSFYEQCIPYEGNEHLLGTTEDCDEYYISKPF